MYVFEVKLYKIELVHYILFFIRILLSSILSTFSGFNFTGDLGQVNGRYLSRICIVERESEALSSCNYSVEGSHGSPSHVSCILNTISLYFFLLSVKFSHARNGRSREHARESFYHSFERFIGISSLITIPLFLRSNI